MELRNPLGLRVNTGRCCICIADLFWETAGINSYVWIVRVINGSETSCMTL